MSYEEFLLFIDELLSEGEITFAEAEQLLSNYDAFSDLEIPLRPESIQLNLIPDAVAISLLMSLVSSKITRQVDRSGLTGALSKLSERQKYSVLTAAQTAFGNSAKKLSTDLTSGSISPKEFQALASESLEIFYKSIAMMSSGSDVLTEDAKSAYLSKLLEQEAYITRFVDQYTLSVLRGNPWSEQYLTSRFQQYAGAMRGFGIRLLEKSSDENYGWVANYVAVDDKRTCSNCSQASINGPYLIGEGPMPGEICFGGHRCRCFRYKVYDLSAYERIVGNA
jgi:hypothetical protein